MGYNIDSIRPRPIINEALKNVEIPTVETLRNEVIISSYHEEESFDLSKYAPKKIYVKAAFTTFASVATFGFILFFSLMTTNASALSNTKVAALPQMQEVKGVSTEQSKETGPRALAEEAISSKINRISLSGVYRDAYVKAGAKYNVPWQVIAAVHFVETGQSGDTDRSSSAGAIGPMQFMPNTFGAYAQDGDGDGVASITNVYDAIYTAAKHLAANGAASGSVSGALYSYNHSNVYVSRVLDVARGFGWSQ